MPNTEKNISSLRWIIPALFVPVLAWFITLIGADRPVTIRQILKIHIEFPVLWGSYLFPLFAIFFAHRAGKKRKQLREKLESNIEKKNAIIARNASFAQELGRGNFKQDIETEGVEDLLGMALKKLQENLRRNLQKEQEENWITFGKERISTLLRMHTRLDTLGDQVLREITDYIQAIQGALFLYHENRGKLTNLATYAYNRKKYMDQEFQLGKGLVGQCAYEMDYIYRTEIPDDYFTISSGILGDRKPKSLLLVPLISDEKLQGVVEFAFLFSEIPKITIQFILELGEIIARTIFNLRVNEQTEKLLEESQQMTRELRLNEEKLKENASLMHATQEELKRANEELENKIRELENARQRQHWLLENSSEIIAIYDKNRKLIFISPSVTSILGYNPREMMKGKDYERLALDGKEKFQELFDALDREPEKASTVQYSFLTKEGTTIALQTTGSNLLDDPSVEGYLLNTRDITESTRAEREERMRTRMQSLSENSLDMIVRLSTEGQFFYVNPVLEDYTGITPSELINKLIYDIELPTELKEYYISTLREIINKPRKTSSELTLPLEMGKKKTERILNLDAIPEFNNGALETILFVGHDITEAKRIEKEIQVKNSKIEDSINYAERIQSSILPDTKLINKYLPRSFIYYQPRDVISGDFPWFFPKSKNELFIAAVDCTGHGVPGALLSFIAHFSLNSLVDQPGEKSPGEVLDALDKEVMVTLKQNKDRPETRDGMDLALCRIVLDENKVEYSGAHRPLYLLRRGELVEYKGDRKAIGGIKSKKQAGRSFTNYSIQYLKGDKFFFFSDGLPDQLGGPANRKYTPKRIRNLLVSNPELSMQEYHELFKNDFDSWIKKTKQIDDVLMIGIEF